MNDRARRTVGATAAVLVAVATMSGCKTSTVRSSMSEKPSYPVAHYPFDGDAIDASGNGHDGTLVGAVPTVDRFGAPSGALHFDGKDDYVNVADDAALHMQHLTVCAWVSPAQDVAGFRMILSKDDNFKGFNFGFPSRNMLAFHVGNSNAWHVLDAEIAFSSNEWHHVAATYDGHRIALFVDGSSVAQKTFTGDIAYGARPVEVGRNAWKHSQYFAGDMDDLRLYGGALSPLEITKLYSEKKSVAEQRK